MFATTFPLTTTPNAARQPNQVIDALVSLNRWTIVSGGFIASALVGRAAALLNGGINMAQLMALLVVAVLALLTARQANHTAEAGTLDARLSTMAVRAGVIQTVLAVVTVVAS